MATWKFKNYASERGENEIRSWIDTLPKAAKIKMDARIRYLESVELLVPPFVKKLVGSDGIYEVRVVSNGVQYRPLGCYGPGKNEFTLLIGAIEKGDKLEPPTAIKTAETRNAIIHNDRSRIYDHFDE